MLAWEGARIHERRGDARRLLLSRLVVDHKLGRPDAFAVEGPRDEAAIADLLLGAAPVPIALAAAESRLIVRLSCAGHCPRTSCRLRRAHSGDAPTDRRQCPNETGREMMRCALIAAAVSLVALPAFANDDIVLRGMGSFHVGGRIAEVTGKPVREIVRQPGGPMTKLDPNGQYMVEQMYVQYFLPKNRKGKCRC